MDSVDITIGLILLGFMAGRTALWARNKRRIGSVLLRGYASPDNQGGFAFIHALAMAAVFGISKGWMTLVLISVLIVYFFVTERSFIGTNGLLINGTYMEKNRWTGFDPVENKSKSADLYVSGPPYKIRFQVMRAGAPGEPLVQRLEKIYEALQGSESRSIP